MADKRISDGPDWTFDLLTEYQTEIERVAKIYKLDTYPNQIEVITAEQMMDAYNMRKYDLLFILSSISSLS